MGAVTILVTLVVCHVAFVALYAHVMDPGHEASHYQDFAQRTGAPFATLLGVFVAFLVARWLIAGAGGNNLVLALALIVAVMVLNALLLLAMGSVGEFVRVPHLLGEAGKLVGAVVAVVLAGSGEPRRESSAVSV